VTVRRRVRIHYHRPPYREDIFDQAIVLERDDVVITYAESAPVAVPVEVDGRVILEPGAPVVWFTFPGAWHDIGRFHRRDGTFTGFYANILTPPEMAEGVWRTTDLFLDVWLPTDPGVPLILDQHELDEAAAESWVDPELVTRARTEAAHLLTGARNGTWPPEITRTWTLEAALAELAKR